MTNRYGAALAQAREHPDFIDLIDTNFHTAGLRYPPDAMRAFCSDYFANPTVSAYAPHPAGDPATRRAIAAWYPQDARIDADAVVVTASASESYGHIFAALCRAGKKVLLPRPGYPLFEDVARRHSLEPAFYPLGAAEQWRPDLESLAQQLDDRVDALVLISPNNPTGRVLSEGDVRAVGRLCRDRGILLIVDEVFSDYLWCEPVATVPGGPSHTRRVPRPATICPDTRVCTINGASKLFGAPELKVSWIAVTGPNAFVREAIESVEVQNDLFLSAAPLNQYLLARMFAEGEAHTARIVGVVRERRDALLEALDAARTSLSDTLAWCEPDGGIHLPIRITNLPGYDDEAITIALLEHDRVNVHPGYLYGIEDETVLITSFLAPAATLREGVRRLALRLSALRLSAPRSIS